MGQISYTIPTAGATLNSTADPEIATALQTLLTLVNGNIDPSNLSAATINSFLASTFFSATYAKAYMANANNLLRGSSQRVPLDTRESDPHNLFSLPTPRYTAPSTGQYVVIGQIATVGQEQFPQAQIFKNGVQYSASPGASSASYGDLEVVTMSLNAADYIELFFFAIGTGGAAISTGVGATFLSIYRLA